MSGLNDKKIEDCQNPEICLSSPKQRFHFYILCSQHSSWFLLLKVNRYCIFLQIISCNYFQIPPKIVGKVCLITDNSLYCNSQVSTNQNKKKKYHWATASFDLQNKIWFRFWNSLPCLFCILFKVHLMDFSRPACQLYYGVKAYHTLHWEFWNFYFYRGFANHFMLHWLTEPLIVNGGFKV